MSVDQYSKYKFLIGENCKIERVTTEEITDITSYDEDLVKIFESVEVFEKRLNKNEEKEENIEIFKELEKNSKTINNLEEYGISYTCKGAVQSQYLDLYSLGFGSGSGINRNEFSLNIDYNKLKLQFPNKEFKGVYGQFHHIVSTSYYSYMSWIFSKIIVTYDDNTTSENTTERDEARACTIELDRFVTVIFEEGKKVSNIQMIIDMFDSDWGAAHGWIKNIGLIE